ncbi:MAG: ion transporter [Bacteroidales bacterium]|nr:ion transporter [Bacteroidales bacterium]
MKKIRKLLLNDTFILWIIIANSIVIFAQGFELSPKTNIFLSNADNLITLLFVLEMITKIHFYGLKGYVKSNWNLFDGILTILAIPSLFFWLYGATGNQLEYFLILRIARIFKFFRFLRFFPDIENLIAGIQRAMKASIIVLLGFFVFIFIISVLSCFIFKNIAPQYFSTPITSFYTIFRIFTIEGWYEVPDSIAQNTTSTIAFFSKIYFITILIAGGILGLSLVNSIFVDAMVSDNNNELERKINSLEEKIDKLLQNNLK